VSEEKLRQDITEICHLVYRKGFVAATDGNISVRLPDVCWGARHSVLIPDPARPFPEHC